MTTTVVVHASNRNFQTVVRQDGHEPIKMDRGTSRSFVVEEKESEEVLSRFEVSTNYQGDPLKTGEKEPNKPEGAPTGPTESEKAGKPGLADRKNPV